MKRLYKNSIAALLIAAFLLSPFSLTGLNRAEALGGGWAVFGKELADAAVWVIANKAIEGMTRETVNWINGTSGPGGPKYVQNLGGFLGNIADETAGEYINSSPFGFVCDPFRTQLRISLARLRIPDTRAECTLSEVIDNVEGFVGGDFYDGGWDAWGELTTRSNPYTQFLQAENELADRIRNRQNIELRKLDFGSGFLSFEVCDGDEYFCIGPEGIIAGYTSSEDKAACEALDASHFCAVPPKIVTPGSVIEDQLNNAIGAGQERLTVADEISEVVSALLSQLVSRVISEGLAGADPDSLEDSDGLVIDPCGQYSVGCSVPNPVAYSACINECESTSRASCEASDDIDITGGEGSGSTNVDCSLELADADVCIENCERSSGEPTPPATGAEISSGGRSGSGPGEESNGDSPGGEGPGGTPPPSGGACNGNDPGAPSTISNVDWHDASIGGWDQTVDNLNVSITGTHIRFNHSGGTSVWPTENGVVGNAWIIAWRDGRWRGGTFEWFRPNQEDKFKHPLEGRGDIRGRLSDFVACPGETYGFVITSLARNGERSVNERSNIDTATWR